MSREDKFKVAILLTFIGGFLEIYSFLLKDNVFATTITANIILMVFNIYKLKFIYILKYLIPIISFCLGIIYVEKIKRSYKDSSFKENILILEIVLILFIYVFKSNYFNLLTTSIISFISAIQIQSFKKIENELYMSTMCTGNTKKLIEAFIANDKIKINVFSSIIASFCTGILVGVILIEYINEASILFLLLPLSLILYFIKR